MESVMIYDVIIVGAGASGLFCAAAMEPAHPLHGLILEKSSHPGTKLLMSGSGQCNITHGGSIKDFIGCYSCYSGFPGGAKGAASKAGSRIRSCLYKYNNLSLMDFLGRGGVRTVIREDGKVFPASMDARDILELLLRKASEHGFRTRCKSPVVRIERDGAHWCVNTDREAFLTKALVIATGGCSYPATGSDGSMFSVLAQDLGIEITPLKPALSSVQVEAYPYGPLSGISFDHACISIWRDGRKIAENTGGLLFTHHDLSGPAVLNISKYAEPGDTLRISYIHPAQYEQALERLKSAAEGTKRSLSRNMASTFGLPSRFCDLLTERYGNSLKTLAQQLTGESFSVSSVTGFDKAMVTSGGVALSEVDLTTMAIKGRPGLYAIGEALDVDGITGGYNLQFAYSSGRAAADAVSAALAEMTA